MKKISALVPALFFITSAFSQIPQGLLNGYYPFCGNTKNLQHPTSSGLAVGASLTQDRFSTLNSAYTFNGTSDYIAFAVTDIMWLDAYSYSLWVKPANNPTSSAMVFSAGGMDQKGQYLTWYANKFQAISYYVNPNWTTYSSAYIYSGTVTANSWHHVAVTRSNGEICIYVDGVKSPSDPFSFIGGLTAHYGTSPQRFSLGVRSNLTDYFQGDMDDMRIYGGVLSQAQVTALYNEGPVPKITIGNAVICKGESFTFRPTGASSYLYGGSSSSTIKPESSWNYTIIGTDNNGCVSTTTMQLTVDACTAVEEISQDKAFNIYPNPNNGQFTILYQSANKNTSFVLRDLSGRVVKSIALVQNNELIQLSDLAEGCYLAQIVAEGKCVQQQKIIVQH